MIRQRLHLPMATANLLRTPQSSMAYNKGAGLTHTAGEGPDPQADQQQVEQVNQICPRAINVASTFFSPSPGFLVCFSVSVVYITYMMHGSDVYMTKRNFGGRNKLTSCSTTRSQSTFEGSQAGAVEEHVKSHPQVNLMEAISQLMVPSPHAVGYLHTV